MHKILLPIICFTASLFAFDTRTHVWIAQEVLNDLADDGKITIAPFGEFDVDPALSDAILQNRRIYRMANIGPDGFPDVIGGQVTVHPGLEEGYIDDDTATLVQGWKSDTWFKWVLQHAQTPQERAFAYGYLAHGAADVFAHTYVNMYSGDIFDMNDGETDVEKRHIFLEKFISDRLPPFKNVQGETIGEAHALVAVDDELPVGFIKETLLMNEEVAAQYALSGTANYLAKMYEFRQKIAQLDDDDTETTLADDLALAQQECSSDWYPGKYLFSIFTSQDEACQQQTFLSQKLEDLNSIKAQFTLSGYSFKDAWLKQVDHAVDAYIKTSSRMNRGFMELESDTYSELSEWITCYGTSFTDPTTIGARAVENGCAVSGQISSELAFLDDVEEKTNFTLLSGLKSEVKTLSAGLGAEIVDLVGVAALEIVTVREQAVSEASLNEQFGLDQSEKHLLLIDDIAQRVKIEMALNMNGELNPQMYHVLYNAVVLSKLTLLDAQQLNELINRAGIAAGYRFVASADEPFNILFNSTKTIDGNHQWLFQAPPYPRREGFDDTTAHFYGYPNDDLHGFKLFESQDLRFGVFNKIFKGPLSLGLETPGVIHQTAVLADGYPFVSCAENPFPDGVDDKRCDTFALDTGAAATLPEGQESWWDSFLRYLKDVILAYFYDLVGEENIIATTETNETIEIITTVPDSGITF
ncbi:hypothetical protein [Sulfurimonas sp. HSL3-7]|uniref:hypothetical protein n=1 Tax=Sulfonitrofixus jiaomeiensis TaxID=3131938 RepID=UPI0031F75FF2